MTRFYLIRVLLLSAALVAAAPVSAEVYQWTDANGALSFSDNPSRAPSSGCFKQHSHSRTAQLS